MFFFRICLWFVLTAHSWPANQNSTGIEIEKLRRLALEKNVIGKTFTYDFTANSECNLSAVKYLGRVTTSEGKSYKVLTSFYVFGTSCRGSSKIVIYNSENVYFGNYTLSMPYELPDTLINNRIFFRRNNGGCSPAGDFSINLESKIPESILIPGVQDGSGDTYLFNRDE